MLSKEEFHSLSEIHGDVCVSIFLSTHRKGQEVLRQEDRLGLKNQIQKIKKTLPSQGLAPSETNSFLEPLVRLLDDQDFWYHQSEGLVIYRSNGFFKKYHVPISLPARTYISTEFLLWPLMSLFVDDGHYLLLTLTPKRVELYQGSRSSFTEVTSKELADLNFDAVVGTDYRQKNLQFRTHHAAHGPASFHGQGAGKDDREEEIFKYLKKVNEVLTSLINKHQMPLILVGLDSLIATYRQVNSYPKLFAEHLSGNPVDYDRDMLHSRSWEIIKGEFEQERREKMNRYNERLDSTLVDDALEQILPAAMEGKIDSLFISEDAEIWGIYDPINQQVKTTQRHRRPNVSLINQAAMLTFQKGGQVYILNQSEMPAEAKFLCALYRYK